MIEVVGMLGMIMVALAFVPVFKWLGRHYDTVEEKSRATVERSQARERESKLN
ncbi:MAG: hypothetical protein IPK60_24075 [Sandaracinaceae bacterium]|jgi:hypothetical protein|nr:hypothetical protein [Sandaracinaceae bacterium]